jgi:hypothetical protein
MNACEVFSVHETNFFSAFCILGSGNLPVVTVYLESGVLLDGVLEEVWNTERAFPSFQFVIHITAT